MKDMKKGLVLASSAAALLVAGFVASPVATAKPELVKCTKKSKGCGRGCGTTTTKVMTVQECEDWGGTPSKLKKGE